jgi:hypothetical protein
MHCLPEDSFGEPWPGEKKLTTALPGQSRWAVFHSLDFLPLQALINGWIHQQKIRIHKWCCIIEINKTSNWNFFEWNHCDFCWIKLFQLLPIGHLKERGKKRVAGPMMSRTKHSSRGCQQYCQVTFQETKKGNTSVSIYGIVVQSKDMLILLNVGKMNRSPTSFSI